MRPSDNAGKESEASMLNLRAQKRTAVDGAVFWCIYDVDKSQWATRFDLCGKYSTRKAARFAINRVMLESLNQGDIVHHATMGAGLVEWLCGEEVGVLFPSATWSGRIVDMHKNGFTK